MTADITIFAYPQQSHARRHGPCGYADYQSYKPWLRDEFAFRCVYCLFRERWFPQGWAVFSIDHTVPQSQAPERICDYENLLYSCTQCNSFKQDLLLPEPCSTPFAAHVRVNTDGSISAISKEGLLLVRVLQLDRPKLNEFRSRLLRVLVRLAPFEISRVSELKSWFGFPDDLPDLSCLMPPKGNKRPDGIKQSYFEQRRGGELADCY